MSIQVIERDGKPEWAVLPYETYLELVEQAEMIEDVSEYDRIKAALAAGEEEEIPSEVVYALLDGTNPVKVWREYRHLTQAQVAESAGISVPYLSQIEAGKRQASARVLRAISVSLNVTIDDLVQQG
jgi:DNA-binding XRE family transcriptional regulator